MKHAAPMVALLLASGLAQAHTQARGTHISCDVGSKYSVSTHRRAFLFTQENKQPTEIGIGGGRLFIDGREETLTAADHQRLRQLETESQLLIPEVKRVVVEAVDIAFTALTEVARGLSNNPSATVSSLESAHRSVRREMSADPLAVFSEDAMSGMVKKKYSSMATE